MRRSAIRVLALALALSTFASPAAGGQSPTEHRRGGPVDRDVRVRISDNNYRPRTLTIDRFTVVQWVNHGNNSHTITSNTNRWDSGTLDPGESFRRFFHRVGTYRYHCTIHPSMRGRIIVVRHLG